MSCSWIARLLKRRCEKAWQSLIAKRRLRARMYESNKVWYHESMTTRGREGPKARMPDSAGGERAGVRMCDSRGVREHGSTRFPKRGSEGSHE